MGPKTYRNFTLALLASGAMVLGGCSGLGRALGISKVSPDEFQVVTKAPLVIPPDFSLKPPAPGTATEPQTEQEMIAQKAMIGEEVAFTPGMSTGERALVASAGATHADPLIRQVVDQDYGNLITRTPGFADRLIFWDKTKHPAESTVDPGNEQQRLQQAQGTKPADKVQGQETPTIKKSSGGIF